MDDALILILVLLGVAGLLAAPSFVAWRERCADRARWIVRNRRAAGCQRMQP